MIEHLSYSSISTYLMCPRSWRFRYVDKVPAAASGAMVFGNAIHGAIEEHAKCGWSTNRIALSQRWDHNWEKQLNRNSDLGIRYDESKGESEESLHEYGLEMLSDPDIEALVDSLKAAIINEQVQIELFVEATVPGVPVPIIGYVDMIEADGVPCDFKTSARSWNQDRANGEMQPVFYLAALNQMGAPLVGNEEGYYFRHYVFVKAKSPKVQIWESRRAVADLFWLFGLIKDVWRGIEAQVFPPNPGTWKCSPKHCEYWALCRGQQ